MSDILIKGMKLPEKCEDCPCYDYIDYVCRADDCYAPFDVENPEERSEHCPLIEIPTPHGRLIDADELIERIERFRNIHNYYPTDIDATMRWFINQICNSKTIIEAEVSE